MTTMPGECKQCGKHILFTPQLCDDCCTSLQNKIKELELIIKEYLEKTSTQIIDLKGYRIKGGYEVIQSLLVSITVDEFNRYLSSDNVFFIHGEGMTKENAIQDYLFAISRLYEFYKDQPPHRWNPENLKLVRKLQKYLRKTE